MKIAVPITNDNQIGGHFGHADSYGVFTISDSREITDIRSVESPQGCGCSSDIASTLSSDGVTVMLAAGIGDGAVNKLNTYGIEVIRGCSGNATEVVRLFIAGQVQDTGSSCDHHHDESGHEHAHTCNHDEPHDHDHGPEHAHAHNCEHHDHHHHEHGHGHAHNCSCN